MSKILSPTTVLMSGVLLVLLLQHAGAQRRYGRISSLYRSSRNIYGQQLIRRIDLLEQRVRILERFVNLPTPDLSPAAPAVTVAGARHELAKAEEQLKAAEYQFRKGAASEAEVEARSFELQRARLLVKLSLAEEKDRPAIQAAIEVVAAEHYLAVAKRSLDLTQRLAAQGSARPADVDAHQQAVEEAQRLLTQAVDKASGYEEP